jgi:hypothetical protein
MALITYHQTLITFVLFYTNMRQIQLRIHINNKKKTPEFSFYTLLLTILDQALG